MKRYKTVDDYIANADTWQAELKRLREILNTTALTEDVKWGAPCYTYKGKNIIGLAAFKGWACLWFHQGATAAFGKLTAGRQREYAAHIASAKRDDTKQKRINKVLPMIAAGIGLHDKYRDC